MGLMPSHFFKPLQQRVVDPSCAELDDKLIVVNCGLFAILSHGALHVPRCDDLFVSSRLWSAGHQENPRMRVGSNRLLSQLTVVT